MSSQCSVTRVVNHTAAIPVETHLESSPSATREACGRRRSSSPADRTMMGLHLQVRQQGLQHVGWSKLRCSLGCILRHHPPGKCRSWQWEIHTESSSVLRSLSGFHLVVQQQGSREQVSPGTVGTSRLRMLGSYVECMRLQQDRLLHRPLDDHDRKTTRLQGNIFSSHQSHLIHTIFLWVGAIDYSHETTTVHLTTVYRNIRNGYI